VDFLTFNMRKTTMKGIFFTSVFLLAGVTGEAIAACSGTQQTDLNTLLSGNTICKSDGSGGWTWQEFHTPGGGSNSLIDYKGGPGHATDPTEPVGSWSINSNNSTDATVTYDYGTGGNYTYRVWGTGPYSFCVGATETVAGATLKTGQGPCL
jgi:hypothetical protein